MSAGRPLPPRALSAAKRSVATGERRGSALREAMQAVLSAEPLARPDYVSVADPLTLQELDDTAKQKRRWPR